MKLNDKTENELTTNDESIILFEIEDKILEKINSNNSLYVGRITNNGFRDFFFYSKNSEIFKSEANKIKNEYLNYKFEIDNKEDKN